MTLVTEFKKWLSQKAILDFLRSLKKDKQTMDFLTGWKTYILAVLLIILGAVEFIGIDVPGFNMSPQEAFGIALGFIFARSGAKSDAKKVENKVTGL